MEPSSEGIKTKKNGSWGAIISIVLILILVIVGAFYSWQKRTASVEEPPSGTAPY